MSIIEAMHARGTAIVPTSFEIQKAHLASLLEVDVTRARHRIRLSNRGGQSAVSFVSWFVTTLARTLRQGRPGGTPSQSVTVKLLIDRVVDDVRVVVPLVIRNAAAKTANQIESLIRATRESALDDAQFITGSDSGLRIRLVRALPGRLRHLLLTRVASNRRRIDRTHADVVVSTSGMGGRVKGWFIPASRHQLCIGIGAVSPKAVVLNGTIEQREVFHLTVLADRDFARRSDSADMVSRLLRSMETARELSLN